MRHFADVGDPYHYLYPAGPPDPSLPERLLHSPGGWLRRVPAVEHPVLCALLRVYAVVLCKRYRCRATRSRAHSGLIYSHSLQLHVCTLTGNFKLGVRLLFIKVYPMEVGNTMSNAF